mmetsp:Transcript_39853/g.123633  ORF Transcript_39853/g.123633 Transcript_39853/m.123633 type:complete len:140 (+) Transcript_39853:388-807(+)
MPAGPQGVASSLLTTPQIQCSNCGNTFPVPPGLQEAQCHSCGHWNQLTAGGQVVAGPSAAQALRYPAAGGNGAGSGNAPGRGNAANAGNAGNAGNARMCRLGCGRKAAKGTTASGIPYDTCCRACAQSGGRAHDARCAG